MTVTKLPFSFPDFVKYPLQAVLFMLLLYFGYKEFTDDCADLRAANADLKADIVVKDKRISTLEGKVDDFTWATLAKDIVIQKLKSQKDSVSHESTN